jgi:hypothetical protein
MQCSMQDMGEGWSPNMTSVMFSFGGRANQVPIYSVPEIIDLVFAKASPKRSFSMTEYERFGLVFTKTRVYKFGHRLLLTAVGGGEGGGKGGRGRLCYNRLARSSAFKFFKQRC